MKQLIELELKTLCEITKLHAVLANAPLGLNTEPDVKRARAHIEQAIVHQSVVLARYYAAFRGDDNESV